MQRINNALEELVKKENFQQRFEGLKQEVVKNPEIKAFINKHQDVIDESMINRSLIKLYEYTTQSKKCSQCESLEKCINMLKGYHPQLVIQGKTIDLQYERCPRKIRDDERKEQEAFIQSLYVPKEILSASFAGIEIEEGRIHAIKLAHEFVRNYQSGTKMKGLYLYGPFGIGKTYLLGAIANQLAEKKIRSLIVYLPEFLRELKGSFQDQSFNEKIEFVKKAPVLMLDDIGAESVTSWMRDDVLGAILQFRMLENLPTFFTSNLNLEELEHHLTYTQRGEVEKVKAARILERIKALAVPVEAVGRNKRH